MFSFLRIDRSSNVWGQPVRHDFRILSQTRPQGEHHVSSTVMLFSASFSHHNDVFSERIETIIDGAHSPVHLSHLMMDLYHLKSVRDLSDEGIVARQIKSSMVFFLSARMQTIFLFPAVQPLKRVVKILLGLVLPKQVPHLTFNSLGMIQASHFTR